MVGGAWGGPGASVPFFLFGEFFWEKMSLKRKFRGRVGRFIFSFFGVLTSRKSYKE